ncbi:MAG: glycosyltransferase family 2 protein [Agriterribacter sp.]
MTDNIPHIAVLMTCFNRRNKTIQCLKNLFSQEEMNKMYCIEVFLVDDASADGTPEAVSALFPGVQIIRGNGHLYWNRGMHTAWETAKNKCDFDYYLWLNDDTDIKPNAIIEMLECTAATKNNAIICGAICSRSNQTFTYGGRTANGEEIHPDGKLQFCHTINGNCVLVSKIISDKIGILDPVYPHAIGDYEYGLRALKAGFEIITTKTYIGYCEKNSSLPLWCYSSVPLMRRMKALYSPLGNSHPYYFFVFEKKYYGWLTAVKHFFSIHLRVLIPNLWK